MAFPPPTYQAAAYRQLWPIISAYVQDQDLYAACLVSRQWHSIFAPLLWGSPASRFGSDSDTVYLSLTRFKRLLTRTRLKVRQLAHTLHVPPADTEFYGGPQDGWLRDVLDRLPALQSLIVSNLSFFDHQSLQSIHHGCLSYTQYRLKLLVASGCQNTTASSLAMALSHFPELIYLDLSGAQGSRSPYVLREIGTLPNLRVLKMRNCGLRDDDVDHLTFTPKLRSLDLNNNFLTKGGVYKLSLLLPPAGMVRTEAADSMNSSSPSTRRYSGVPLSTRVLSQGLDIFVANRLMSGLDGETSIQEGLPKSFSHLYLASNNVSLDAITRLIDRPDLQHLDAGPLSLSQSNDMLSPRSVGSGSARFSDSPTVEILSPALFCHAFRNIKSLRLHHSVITSRPFSGSDKAIEETCFELHGEDLRYELDSTSMLKPGTFFELEDTSSNPTPEPPQVSLDMTKEAEVGGEDVGEHHATFESPDDVGAQLKATSPSESQRPSNVSRQQELGSVSPLFSKGATPKLSVSGHRIHNKDDCTLSPTLSPSEGPQQFKYNYAAALERPWQEALRKPKPTTPKEILSEALQRKHRIEARERHPGRLKPYMLPNLRILALTDVPSTTRRRGIIDALTTFIQECAEEEELARLEECVRNPRFKMQIMENSQKTLRLNRLILEMCPLPDPILPSVTLSSTHLSSNSQQPHIKRHSFTHSSTEDADSETFMSYSLTDFSFFSEDDGGLLVSEGRIDAPIDYDEGMVVGNGMDGGDGREVDVVSELAGLRRERRRVWEGMQRLREGGGVEEALLGHWRGKVEVLRV